MRISTNSSTINDQLSLNCTSTKPTKPNQRKFRVAVNADGSVISTTCLGSIFDHHHNDSSHVDPNSEHQFSSNETGDLVYKSDQRAPNVFVQSKNGSYFDASNGFLEIYGPANGQNRRLLGRVGVRILRGEFAPRFNGANITGSVKITSLELVQSSSIQSSDSLSDQCITKLTRFARPLLTEMFNVFFERYAQFAIPLLDGFKCVSPDFSINSRSMQVDCDFWKK